MDTSTQPKTPESFTPVYLTEVEREVLEKLGWSPGDPVPKTLVEHLETLPEGDISQGVLINLKSELAAAKAREEMAQRTQADAPEQPAAGASGRAFPIAVRDRGADRYRAGERKRKRVRIPASRRPSTSCQGPRQRGTAPLCRNAVLVATGT